jgi:hypothetical protein
MNKLQKRVMLFDLLFLCTNMFLLVWYVNSERETYIGVEIIGLSLVNMLIIFTLGICAWDDRSCRTSLGFPSNHPLHELLENDLLDSIEKHQHDKYSIILTCIQIMLGIAIFLQHCIQDVCFNDDVLYIMIIINTIWACIRLLGYCIVYCNSESQQYTADISNIDTNNII